MHKDVGRPSTENKNLSTVSVYFKVAYLLPCSLVVYIYLYIMFKSSSPIHHDQFQIFHNDFADAKDTGTDYFAPVTDYRLPPGATVEYHSHSEFLDASLAEVLSLFEVTSGLQTMSRGRSKLRHPELYVSMLGA